MQQYQERIEIRFDAIDAEIAAIRTLVENTLAILKAMRESRP